jgi:hypothetical protein
MTDPIPEIPCGCYDGTACDQQCAKCERPVCDDHCVIVGHVNYEPVFAHPGCADDYWHDQGAWQE